jgi:hypothetical protein
MALVDAIVDLGDSQDRRHEELEKAKRAKIVEATKEEDSARQRREDLSKLYIESNYSSPSACSKTHRHHRDRLLAC